MQQMVKAVVYPRNSAASCLHFRQQELALGCTLTCCFSFEEILLRKRLPTKLARLVIWSICTLAQAVFSPQTCSSMWISGWSTSHTLRATTLGCWAFFLVVFFFCVTSSSGV